jgi:flavin reductase (DIM6/NTAB) family NADH-FMN oxidoreductase RutF
MSFTTINPEEISENALKLIGKDWMLVSAGNSNSNNCMTASWGGIGVLWFKPVVYVFIRPQRYTKEFIEKNDYFTLSFFEESYRPALNFCGKNSGKTINKAKECGLDILETTHGSIAYKQAKLILECKKMYAQPFNKESFIDKSPLHHYEQGDFHIMYIAEITECLIKEF